MRARGVDATAGLARVGGPRRRGRRSGRAGRSPRDRQHARERRPRLPAGRLRVGRARGRAVRRRDSRRGGPGRRRLRRPRPRVSVAAGAILGMGCVVTNSVEAACVEEGQQAARAAAGGLGTGSCSLPPCATRELGSNGIRPSGAVSARRRLDLYQIDVGYVVRSALRLLVVVREVEDEVAVAFVGWV